MVPPKPQALMGIFPLYSKIHKKESRGNLVRQPHRDGPVSHSAGFITPIWSCLRMALGGRREGGGWSCGSPTSLGSPGDVRHPAAPRAGANGDAGCTGLGRPCSQDPSAHLPCTGEARLMGRRSTIHSQSPTVAPGATGAAGKEKGGG